MNPDHPDLLAELGALLRRACPLPSRVIADAEAALALASTDLVLLEPVAELTAVRAVARSFRFTSGQNDAVGLDLELRGARLSGLVSPVGELEVRWPGGSTRTRPDAAGFFLLDGVPRGPVQVVVGAAFATPWLRA